jgi:hypothetical protein
MTKFYEIDKELEKVGKEIQKMGVMNIHYEMRLREGEYYIFDVKYEKVIKK